MHRGTHVCVSELMSFTPTQSRSPDMESLPLKKRDQGVDLTGRQYDAHIFKKPSPFWSSVDSKVSGQIRPGRAPALYQPWTHVGYTPKTQDVHWTYYPVWDFSHLWQRYGLLPDHLTDRRFHLDSLQRPTTFDNISLAADGFHNNGAEGWQHLKTSKSIKAERRSAGGGKAPYVRRDGRSEWLAAGVGTGSSTSFSGYKALKHDAFHTPGNVPNYISTRSPNDVSHSTFTPFRGNSSACTSATSSTGDPAPWLQPHFMAGSLVELQDGRLRKVEHLKTEDFLLGSLASTDLRLGCCTVQSITSSPASSSASRLLILIHDLQSQELVDVYAEYPFFVSGQGWSSCSPERTARLCGLQCHQLSVGDVCLALTPLSSRSAAEDASDRKSEGRRGSLKEPTQHRSPPVGKRTVRRRHSSAPDPASFN